MDKTKFDILYESIIDELNSLEDLETEVEQEYKSFNEFKQFCKRLDLIAELDQYTDTDKVVECSLYFMKEFDTENKPVRFDFFNQNDIEYYKENHTIFDELSNYKKHYIVTLSGKEKSPRIIWG